MILQEDKFLEVSSLDELASKETAKTVLDTFTQYDLVNRKPNEDIEVMIDGCIYLVHFKRHN